MKTGTLITSHHNPKIKSLRALEKPRERKRQGLFVIEGINEITRAREAGYAIENLFFCEDIIAPGTLAAFSEIPTTGFPVSREVFEKIAIRETSGGLVAVATYKTHHLDQLTLSKTPLVLVLERVEKPGNLGAILRIADAAAVDAVIICDPQTDFYNPNVIRSSVGCVFTNQLAATSSEEAIQWLQGHQIKLICTYLEAAHPYHEIDYTQPCAVVMGTEATGLSDIWVQKADTNVIIPMGGKIDSMNVSTAAAVVIFEARRQRQFRSPS